MRDYLLHLPVALAVLTATIAMVTDMRSGKIRNWLTFPMMLAGFFVNFLLFGFSGFGYSLLGCFIGHLLYGAFACFGIVGMGDVKLLGALGALGGGSFVFGTFLYASVIGIPHALAIQFLNHGSKGLKLLVISLKTGSFRNRSITSENSLELQYRFFLGIDILLGVILALVYPLNLHF